jgi:tetratricopeptide (TPR) repeat protein
MGEENLYTLGISKVKEGDFKEALGYIDLHILIHIKDPKAHLVRARLRFNNKDYKGCIQDCVRCGEIDNTYISPHIEYDSWLNYRKGNYILTEELAEEILTNMEKHNKDLEWVEFLLFLDRNKII